MDSPKPVEIGKKMGGGELGNDVVSTWSARALFPVMNTTVSNGTSIDRSRLRQSYPQGTLESSEVMW